MNTNGKSENHIEPPKDFFCVGICVGICPDEAREREEHSFEEFELARRVVFRRLRQEFAREQIGVGERTDKDVLYVMGTFSLGERETFLTTRLDPLRGMVEEECSVSLCMGISAVAEGTVDAQQLYREAITAFGLYRFEERKILRFFQNDRDYLTLFANYKEDADRALRSILTKEAQVMERIDRVMDDIEALDYGNWNAAVMRTMIFTGDLGFLLHQYRLLDMRFDEMQDALQEQVEAQDTMRALKRCIHDHFENLLSRIYATGRSQEKVLIEDVKKYIRDHYAEDLSIGELAKVACVSPNYFSAMFKKETGQNYKAYLTSLRMEAAIGLLQETDYKIYEVAERAGYNNVRRFVDAFKQIYGVSPMEYRKRFREE